MYLDPQDPRWVGAWWIGYVIAGAFLIVSCVILLGFPRDLPGARERREKVIEEGNLPSKDEKIKETFRDIIPATLKLLKNPVFVFNALAVTASTFFGAALVPFLPKILDLKFALTPSMAGLMMGTAVVPASIGKYHIQYSYPFSPKQTAHYFWHLTENRSVVILVTETLAVKYFVGFGALLCHQVQPQFAKRDHSLFAKAKNF